MPTTVNDREMRGSDFRVGISPQTLKGAINANPVFVPVRRTEGKNEKNVSYTEDPSVNGMMQAKEQIKESESFTAEIQSVVTKQSIGFLIQAIHADTVDLGFNGSASFTATGISSAGAFADYVVGQGLWVVGSTGGLNDGFYVVKSIVSDGEIITEPAPQTVQPSAAIAVSSQVSHNRDLPTYNSMQTRGADKTQPDDINYYTQIDGVINEHNLEIPETGLWTSTSNFVFESEYVDNPSPITGQSYTAPPTDRAVTSSRNAVPGIKSFFVDNIRQTCKIKSLSLAVANNYQEDPFAACPASWYRGDFQVSGNFIARTLISNPFSWRDKCWNSIRFSIAFLLTHGNGEETYVIVHQSVSTEATMPDGSGQVSHTEVAFSAEEQQAIQTTITVCRNWE